MTTPPDVLKMAREIVARIYRANVFLNDSAAEVLRGEHDDGTVMQAAITAIMAERQRCEKQVTRLKGTLSYIAAQADSPAYDGNPKLALSAIKANAKSACDDAFQEVVAAAIRNTGGE